MNESPFQPPPPSVVNNEVEEQKIRFQTELEFVNALANPYYINFLAQREYFKDKAVVNYLKYLLYWTRPEYVVYIKYPQCLHYLQLLQHAAFRESMKSMANAQMCEDQQLLQWQMHVRRRHRLMQFDANQLEPTNSADTPDN